MFLSWKWKLFGFRIYNTGSSTGKGIDVNSNPVIYIIIIFFLKKLILKVQMRAVGDRIIESEELLK